MRIEAITTISLTACAILLFCIPSFSQPQEEKMRVAVVEFDEKGEVILKDAGAIVAEWILTSLAEESDWQLVERALLKKVLEEKGLALTGVLEPETTSKIGRIWRVDHLVVGSVMKFGSQISVTARLVDTESAAIIRPAQIRTSDLDSLLDKIPELTEALIGGNRSPTITSLSAQFTSLSPGKTSFVTCQAEDPDDDTLAYSWSSSAGSFEGEGTSVKWISPSAPGDYLISVKVEDGKGGVAEKRIVIEVTESTTIVRRPWIGIYMQELTRELAEKFGVKKGVLVADVVEGSPADKAGIQAGDVIQKVNGKPVDSGLDLREEILKTEISEEITLSLIRKGEEMDITFSTGKEPQEVTQISEDALSKRLLGIQVHSITPELQEKYDLKEGEEGVVVTEVVLGGPAARAQVSPGDVIKSVNKVSIRSLKEFQEAMEKVKPGDIVRLRVRHGIWEMWVTVPTRK